MNDQPARKTFFGGCPHDCPDTCAMIYEVEDGKLVEVRGNKDHPMTRGTLCVKLKDYHDHHYNPDRVLYPLRRSGPKGSRQFTRIGWDEAIAEITSRWTSSRNTAARRSCRTPISAMKGWCRG
jgi:anaerobic selenocysteine-containing dehydrogenase